MAAPPAYTQPLESEPFYRLLLGSISDALFVADAQGHFTFVSPNAHVIFGFTDVEVARMGRVEALLGPDVLPADPPAEGVEIANLERVVRDKFGRDHVVLVSLKGVRLRGGTTLITCRDITARKADEQRLASYQRRLRALASQVGLTAESERRRIAQALHDVVVQKLAVVKLRLGSMQEGNRRQTVAGVLGLLDELIGDCRHLTFELSPPVLHELGLGPALEWLAEYAERESGLSVRVRSAGAEQVGSSALRVTLFAAARELLRNAAEHGRARQAELALDVAGGRCTLSVTDDGVGFDPSRLEALGSGERGWGLLNMRVQAEHVGGRLRIRSRPGHGTTVTFVAPLKTNGGARGQEGGDTDVARESDQLGIDERRDDGPDDWNPHPPRDAG